MAEVPIPVSAVSRHRGPERPQHMTRHKIIRRGLVRRLEERDPYVVVLFKSDLHCHPDVDVFHFTSDDVRRETDAWIIVQRDNDDGIRVRSVGEPPVIVHGDCHDHATAGDGCNLKTGTPAPETDRRRWVLELATSRTTPKAQLSVLACCPEEGSVRRQLGQRAMPTLRHGFLSSCCGDKRPAIDRHYTDQLVCLAVHDT